MKKEHGIIAILLVLIVGFLVYQISLIKKLQNESNELASRDRDLRERLLKIEKRNRVVDLDEYRAKAEFESQKYQFKFSSPPQFSFIRDNKQTAAIQFLFSENNDNGTINYSTVDFAIQIKENWEGDLTDYAYLGEPPRNDPVFSGSSGPMLGNREALFFSSEGYCDAGFCGGRYIAYVTKYNEDLYLLIFYGDRSLDGKEKAIRDSFAFTTD